MKLGIDLDGTSCHYDSGYRAFLGRRAGIPSDQWMNHFPELKTYTFWENGWTGISTFEEFWSSHLDAVRDGLFARLEAFPYLAEESARLASEGHELTVITARDLGEDLVDVVMDTTEQFFKNSGMVYHNLIIANDKRGLNMDVYFDDAPHNVEQLRAEGKHVVVADQLHNRHIGGLRATNWRQFGAIVDALAEERSVEHALARVA